MSIQIDATYRAGVIHPNEPLDLPDNTPVSVVVPVKEFKARPTRDEIIAMRPKSPKITVEEFHALLDKYAVSSGGLPLTSRKKTFYSDHD